MVRRGKHRAAVLELRWQQPLLPTARRGETEIAYLRYGEDHYRVTVVPLEKQTYVQSNLSTTPLPSTILGWGVAMNGELLAGDPLSFTDACYAGWAVFVETVPNLARFTTQGVAWTAAKLDGYDPAILEVEVVHGHRAEPAAGTRAGAGGTQEAGPDAAAVRPLPGPTDEARGQAL